MLAPAMCRATRHSKRRGLSRSSHRPETAGEGVVGSASKGAILLFVANAARSNVLKDYQTMRGQCAISNR